MTFETLAAGGDAAAAAAADLFGEGATAAESFGLLTVDVPAASWVAALTAARDVLGCTYFDWLSAVDEADGGFAVVAHLVAVGTPVRRLLLRTRVPRDAPAVATVTGVYPGAAWHERETHEMFGIDFTGHPHLVPLLLPEGFEGHPLRKEFVLAARVAKAWPGAKEPGESEHGGPRRRQMLPPGVPDPNTWGPLKGSLPAEPSRPGRPARPGGAPGAPSRRAVGDRPRRTRSAGQGSVSQQPPDQRQPASDQPDHPGSDPNAPRRTPDAPWQRPRAEDDATATATDTDAPGPGPDTEQPREPRAPRDPGEGT
ncbi:NADH-quinone oxidoreductase subunit C [Wenjunlia vitaminophila]|uniref:NADH-quinone oxidoreductase subunit C n=1 Tax=Wenjunlia vitaminophila TaxID=76728 RepID=UPI0003A9B33E|nr:NADH-quinone oxidoreductase subunit C [Wenjunlia vitaminophila]